MSKLDEHSLSALKTAFCYMPKAIDVNAFDFAGREEKTLADIELVREVLLMNDVDPDEVEGEMDPDSAGSSSY